MMTSKTLFWILNSTEIFFLQITSSEVKVDSQHENEEYFCALTDICISRLPVI